MAVQDSRELSGETARYFTRNLAVNVLVDFTQGLGLAMTAAGTIGAVFLHSLGASNAVVGAAPGLGMAAYVALQLPSVQLAQGLRAKKPILVWGLVAAYLPWVPIALLTPVWARAQPGLMTVAFLGLFTLSWLLWGTASPAWGQLLPRLFPDRRRGFAMGVIVAASGAGGLVGGWYAGFVLSHYPYPQNFARLFLTAALVMVAGRCLNLLSHETVPRQATRKRPKPLARVVAHIWHTDFRLRRFLAARYVFEAGGLVGVFFALRTLDRFDLPVAWAGYFSLVLSLGSSAVAPLLGRLGDKRGYRRVMSWGMVIGAAASLLVMVAPTPALALGVFLLAGAANAADGVAYTNLLVEMSEEKRRGHYVALGFSAMAPMRLLAPILWGLVADRVGLAWIFPCGLALQLAGWGLLTTAVEEPRRPGRRVLHWQHGWLPLPRFFW